MKSNVCEGVGKNDQRPSGAPRWAGLASIAVAMTPWLSGCSGYEAQPGESDDALRVDSLTQFASQSDCAAYYSTPGRGRAECVEYMLDQSISAPPVMNGMPALPRLDRTYRHSSALDGLEYAQHVTWLTTGASGLFPGAMHDAQSAGMHLMDSPLFSDAADNSGGTLTVSGANFAVASALSYRKVPTYQKGVVESAIRAILNEGQAVITPSTSLSIVDSSKAKRLFVDAKVTASVAFKLLDFTADDRGELERSTRTTDITAHFSQDFFSVSVPQINTSAASGFLKSPVTPQRLTNAGIGPSLGLTYVSRVNYGRETFARFRSDHSLERVNAALSHALTIVGKDFGVDISPKLNLDHKKVLDETQVLSWSVGVDRSTPFLTATEFVRSVLSLPAFGAALSAVPLSYVVNHSESNRVLSTARISDFHVVKSVNGRRQVIRMRHGGAKVHQGGDRVGQGDVSHEIYLRQTNLNGSSTYLFHDGWTNGVNHVSAGTILGGQHQPTPVLVNLDTNPTFLFHYRVSDLDWWNGWNQDKTVSGTASMSFTNGVWDGSGFFEAGGTTPQRVERTSGDGGDRLRVDMPSNQWEWLDSCGPGYGWHVPLGVCVPEAFSIANSQHPEAQVCITDQIPIDTSTVFATSKQLKNTTESYQVIVIRLNGAYPNYSVDNSFPAFSAGTTLDSSSNANDHLPQGTLSLHRLFEHRQLSLEGGKTYRVTLHGPHIGSPYQVSYGERQVYVRGIGVKSVIDGTDAPSVVLPPSSPLLVSSVAACGSGDDYQVTVERFTNGSWQTLVSQHALERSAGGFSLRDVVKNHTVAGVAGSEILPGDRLRVSFSVTNTDRSSVATVAKEVQLEGCAAGTTSIGGECHAFAPTWIRASDGGCLKQVAVGGGVDFAGSSACTGSYDFHVVDLAPDSIAVRGANNLCLERSVSQSLPLVFRPCTGSERQSFQVLEGDGSVRLQFAGPVSSQQGCWRMDGYLAQGDCAVGTSGNTFQLAWTPPPSQRPLAWQTAQLLGTNSISDGSAYGSVIADWDPGYFKGTCADGTHAMTGLSYHTADFRLHKQLCASYHNTGTQTAVLRPPHDQRRMQRGGDWAPHSYKLECGFDEYVSGVSQDAAGNIHAVRCSRGLGTAAGCETRATAGGDQRGAIASGDWAPGYFKSECSAGKVVVGVSTQANTSTSTPGKATSVLCCNR